MVRRKSPIALALLVAAVVVSGCGTARDDRVASHPTASPSDAPGSRTRVVVTDAGSEPRQTLRFAVAAGGTQHATMTMQMDSAVSLNGRAQPSTALPPMQMGMTVTIPKVEDSGAITATFRYDHLKVLGTGKIADQLQAGLAPLSKVTGTLRTTASGGMIDADLDLPGNLDPTMKSLLDSIKEQLGNMVVPLPSEPVGVGATWTVHTESAIGGIKATIEYSYKLLAHQGDRWVLQATYVQSVPEQDPHLPTMPAGATTHVYASKVTGSGRTVVDLGQLFPVESSVETKGPVHMLVTQQGQKADIVQRMHLVMKLSH